MAGDQPEKDKGREKSPWGYLNIGFQFGITVALFTAIGWWLDSRFDWEPWGIVSLSLFGVAAATYHLLKEVT